MTESRRGQEQAHDMNTHQSMLQAHQLVKVELCELDIKAGAIHRKAQGQGLELQRQS
jgi:hypothetical protein